MTNGRELNLDALNDSFDIDTSDLNLPIDQDTFEEVEIDYDDPVSILKGNIKKANQFLDKIQNEMVAGNFTARMAEVAGNLINSITAASKEIIGDTNYQKYLGIREELAKLKEREVIIKEKSGVKGGNIKNQQNIIVTNREDLLKIMDKKEDQKQLEPPMKQITDNTRKE